MKTTLLFGSTGIVGPELIDAVPSEVIDPTGTGYGDIIKMAIQLIIGAISLFKLVRNKKAQ